MFPKEENPRIDRVRFELRTSGINIEAANSLRSGIHTRGYLPHVKREGARYFITFRLADSLPKEILLKFQAERAERLRRFSAREESRAAVPPEETLDAIEREYPREAERYLDRGCGECWLKRPDIANLVAGTVRFFEGQRYRLDAWVVMPNHSLSEILKSWKGYTARQANRLLDRIGNAFWQPETFDHWIRDDEEHARCCRYVVNNPVKAHLCAAPEDWNWSSAWHGTNTL